VGDLLLRAASDTPLRGEQDRQGKPKQHASRDLSERELECLIANVYFEARGEDALGQAAVAHVTLNRVKSPSILIWCVMSSGSRGS
jgi:spore germination cell wall hydrolase CwlJ-like protein